MTAFSVGSAGSGYAAFIGKTDRLALTSCEWICLGCVCMRACVRVLLSVLWAFLPVYTILKAVYALGKVLLCCCKCWWCCCVHACCVLVCRIRED
jgi:hypothetical protein